MKTTYLVSFAAMLALTACGGSNNDRMTVPTPDVTPSDINVVVDVNTPDATLPDVNTPDVKTPDVTSTDAADGSVMQDAIVDVPMMVTCPSDAPVLTHSGDIRADETWDCTRTHVLMGDGVFVLNNATLRITAGTVVKGGGERSALVVTSSGRIDAQGTVAQPVVFTSGQPVGMRRSAQWGGVVLLGRARINSANTDDGGVAGQNQIEGIPPTDGRARYGGTDDDHNCGTLRYVRIEFPGYELSSNNELNGLTMGGCGRRTTVDYVEVYNSADDGVEIFGGTVDVKHLVIANAEDDGLDWDFGWTGRAQFVAIHSPTTSTEADPNGMESDNEPRVFAAMPVSDPLIYNVTLRGPGAANMITVGYRGAVLRRGTAGRLHNFIVTGYPTQAIDLRDTPTIAFATANPPRLFANNSIFFGNNPAGMQFADNGMDMFDEEMFFTAAARSNRTTDPMLPAYVSGSPSFAPAAGSPAATGSATPPSDGFFQPAPYVGAVEPGSTTNWTTGWTAFPAN
jgi:hypothetical protein